MRNKKSHFCFYNLQFLQFAMLVWAKISFKVVLSFVYCLCFNQNLCLKLSSSWRYNRTLYYSSSDGTSGPILFSTSSKSFRTYSVGPLHSLFIPIYSAVSYNNLSHKSALSYLIYLFKAWLQMSQAGLELNRKCPLHSDISISTSRVLVLYACLTSSNLCHAENQTWSTV